MSGSGRLTTTYVRRAVVYLTAAVVGSAIGSLWTWRTDVWSDANPLVDGGAAALLSLVPAIAVLAIARLSSRATIAMSILLAVGIVAMWWAFARNDSSSSSLVFLLGWIVGLPVAAAIVVLARRRTDEVLEPLDITPVAGTPVARLPGLDPDDPIEA